MPETALAPPTPSNPSTPVVRALRKLRGRATIGDVVAATGLSRDEAEARVRELLEVYQGHLEATESGELVYRFDRRLIRRDHVPLMKRLGHVAGRALAFGFKAWIMAMLVAYFVVFVVLVLAVVVAAVSRGGRGGGGLRRRHGRLPIHWLLYMFWAPDWRYGGGYYGHRKRLPRSRRDREPTVPFYKKVFAFVFGPDRPRLGRHQRDRSILELIRARRGVLTPAELVQHSGLSLPEAENEMGRLMAAYGGDPRVSSNGEVVYAFPELMLSAHGPVTGREPKPAWRRLEGDLPLTGNTKLTDVAIGGMNGFNLLMAATAPVFLFPRLGIGGPGATVGLVFMPVVFSTLFFAVPLVRSLLVARENAARKRRNDRKVLLGSVYRAALAGGAPISETAARSHVEGAVEGAEARPESVRSALHRIATEFEAEVTSDENGTLWFAFPRIREAFLGAEEVRDRLRLERRELGDVVYSSADTPEEAHERDLRSFDRELRGYLAAPDRIGYLDDFEAQEVDEELERGRHRQR